VDPKAIAAMYAAATGHATRKAQHHVQELALHIQRLHHETDRHSREEPEDSNNPSQLVQT